MITGMSSPAPTSSAFASVFEREFDVAVCGAGFVGFAAARELARQGLSTLLLDPSGDLLWEATRALENTARPPSEPCPEWNAWLDEARRDEGADDACFDPAFVEILAARALSAGGPGTPTPLLYTAPVAAEREGDALVSVVVATKDGVRRVRARRWLDATERGDLVRLLAPDVAPRSAATLERALLLHSRDAGALDAALNQLCERDPMLRWSESSRPQERRVLWRTPADQSGWHRRVPEIVSALRAAAGPETPFVLSLCGMRAFPTYAAGDAPLAPAGLPSNLAIASPALRGEAIATPADRFALGTRFARACAALPPAPATGARGEPRLPDPVEIAPASDVLVAGAGTGGAVAAIAAARAGARVRAIDFTSWPGGVGTGAGICGYFHGAKGGLYEEIDERTRRLTELFTGAPAASHGWHHESKKLMLLEFFAETGVEFVGEAFLVGTVRQGARVEAALAVIDGRLVKLPAAAFIDGTGDGDLAVFAGASFVAGRPGDHRTLSYSQSVFWLGAKEDGRPLARSCNFDAGWVDPNDAEDLTRARLLGISQHFRAPWTHPDRPFAVSPWIGLRQSRHIETDHMVRFADLVESARFDDSIGDTETVADTHSVDFEFETDEMAFYYWSCRGFRNPLRSELPYRMILPRGLDNVWIACRAAGVAVDAAYGLRMQRDLQRLGEAAGLAAAQVASKGVDARSIDFAALQAALLASGAKPSAPVESPSPEAAELLAALDHGLPGVHLWHLYRDRARHEAAIRERLASGSPRVSFYAAVVLAMWEETDAEPRLLAAITDREEGPAPEEKVVGGAFGQCIDLPFWAQAVLLLRRAGTASCLPVLRQLAGQPDLPLNIRTTLALTLERLAARLGAQPDLLRALESLTATEAPDPVLPPSRSIWRTLRGEPQKKLANDKGSPTAQDHTWQLHLVVARTHRALGLQIPPAALAFTRDPRAFVRHAFGRVLGA